MIKDRPTMYATRIFDMITPIRVGLRNFMITIEIYYFNFISWVVRPALT
jgi:hypothetical protein